MRTITAAEWDYETIGRDLAGCGLLDLRECGDVVKDGLIRSSAT